MNTEPHSPIRVLLIEDDPNYAKTVRLVLSEAPGSDFRVEWADCLAGGLQRLAEGPTDVVLLDLQLPDSNGLETFSRLHRDYPDVPIVVLTGAADDARAIESVRQGAQDYLVKGEANNALICRSLRYATERHRLTALLAQAGDSLFQSAMANNRDGILIVDENGITRFANPAAHSFFDRPELVGSRFGFPMASDEATEQEIVGPSGIIRTVEMRVAPIIWEGAPASLASLRDLTDRVQALERERHLNAVLRAIRNVNQLITREEDPDHLLRRACENLTETMGYPHAWIVLLDDRGKPTTVAQSAANPAATEALSGLLAGRELPRCVRQALASPKVVVTRETAVECPGCPLAGTDAGYAVQTARLEFEGVVYGAISAALPLTHLSDPQQHGLFLELASDLGFALRKIELARQHREFDRQIEGLSRFPAENPNPVIRLSTGGEVLYANRAGAAVLAASGLEPDGRVDEAWRERVRAAMAKGQPEEAEILVEETLFATTFVPVLEYGYVNAYLSDITERKRAEEMLARRAQELSARNEELERFNRASVGREFRMIELKQEVDELCQQAGQPPRYPRAEGSVNTVDTVGTSS